MFFLSGLVLPPLNSILHSLQEQEVVLVLDEKDEKRDVIVFAITSWGSARRSLLVN